MRYCALGKTGRAGLQIGIFRRKIFEPNFLCFFIFREALKSLMKTATLCDQQQCSTEAHASLHLPQTKTAYMLTTPWASLVAQLVKNPPETWEIWVRSMGWEDPLEKEKATHSSTVAWRILWTV